jgi:hypothetical protein
MKSIVTIDCVTNSLPLGSIRLLHAYLRFLGVEDHPTRMGLENDLLVYRTIRIGTVCTANQIASWWHGEAICEIGHYSSIDSRGWASHTKTVHEQESA